MWNDEILEDVPPPDDVISLSNNEREFILIRIVLQRDGRRRSRVAGTRVEAMAAK